LFEAELELKGALNSTDIWITAVVVKAKLDFMFKEKDLRLKDKALAWFQCILESHGK